MPFFRLRITCFLEIHMDVGTPWLISVTLMEVHLLLRMPYRCVELKKWLIEWLEELSNKVVNNSYKIKISFELFLYKSQFLFWIWIIIFQKVSYHWNLQEQVKKAFYFENILIVDFETHYILACTFAFAFAFAFTFAFAFDYALYPLNTRDPLFESEIWNKKL